MSQKPAAPKDASAVILLNHNLTEVLWAQRNPKLAFLGGWHAFPGGKVEPDDAQINVKNCDKELAKFIVAAARECFEETGVLLARGGEKLTKGQRVSLHDDLVSGRTAFSEILADWGLRIDAEDFAYTGFWTTPEFSPVRFKTRFFLAVCPSKQTPRAAISELRDVAFIEPKKALKRWTSSDVLISPPVFIVLKELAENIPLALNLEAVISNLSKSSRQKNGDIHYIDFNPRVTCFPLKTDTLPPATHTNCFIVGRREFVVIDAASKDKSEQRKLFALVDSFIEKDYVCREIIVSHLHKDHFGGETVLQKHLREKFGLNVPISAHEITAESLRGKVKIDRFIADDEAFRLKDERGAAFELRALYTPGHARGHLCFYDEALGFLLSCDNVVGFGTVLIAPPEGDMSDYLSSLERMKNLPNLKFLCGSHGAAVFDARGKIEEYISHRKTREKQILEAIENGAKTPEEIAEKVYAELNPKLFLLAVESVKAHLAKLLHDGLLPSDFNKFKR